MLRKQLFYTLLLFVTSYTSLFGQNEASNWYFGQNAGISFNENTVSSLNNGQLNTREGCASISDENGNLLFYTDGTTVYNSNHQVMDNGVNLRGDESSTQSALVVPKPNTPYIYYIFTVGSNQTTNGLFYYTVDMSLNNGLGAVIDNGTELLQRCSEKISAVLKDCQTGSIWIIAFSDEDGFFTNDNARLNTFFAFEVTENGVNTTTPTASTFNTLQIDDLRGYLKLSPDGTKLACANGRNGMFLYDFDSQTGLVSNQQRLTFGALPTTVRVPYGVEFSPDSSLLYLTVTNDFFSNDESESENPANHLSALVQFNLNAANINNNMSIIDQQQLYRGGLQLGPNGKIYRSLSATYSQGLSFLDVINNPNEIGSACNYEYNAVSLGNKKCTQGLPPFIQSFFTEKINIIQNNVSSTYLDLCNGDTYTLTANSIPNATYTWSFNGTTLTNNINTLNINEPGHYEVYINLNTGNCEFLEGEAFVTYFNNPTANNTVLTQCDNDTNTNGITAFNLLEANNDIINSQPNNNLLTVSFYASLADATSLTNELNANEYYNSIPYNDIVYAIVTNTQTGCSSTIATITLTVNSTQAADFSIPLVCDTNQNGIRSFNLSQYTNTILTNVAGSSSIALTLEYYETKNDALLEINPLPQNYTNTTPYNQTIYARIESANSCYSIIKVFLIVSPLPDLQEYEIVFYCLNSYPKTITLSSHIANSGNYTFLWNTGETTSQININEIGTYTVTVTNNNGCSSNRTITVKASNTATIETIEILKDFYTTPNSLNVVVTGEGIYQYALYNQDQTLLVNWQDSSLFPNVAPGIYTIKVKDLKNDCGIVEKSISVIGFPKFFTPNNDGINDTWQIYGASNQFYPNTKIYIFDRYGKLITQLNSLDRGWDGTLKGKPLPTNDYWFFVKLSDGSEYKNHFTLKR